jgi:hypothetical protein
VTRLALQRLETLNWVLIYLGIAVAIVGLFIGESNERLSLGLLLAGGLVFVLGVGGIFLRAWLERDDPAAVRRAGGRGPR